MTEAQIQTKILKILKENNCYVIKTIATNKAGTPDIIFCKNGKFGAIEVKRPGGKPTKLQLATLRKISEAGGLAVWTDNPQTIERLLTTLF